uniref:Non-specific lipid-transfer protein n=2 Tax=Nicotiana TaxID=4085 RepID=A0A1S3X0V1_TOBAC|nr:PREDICTED: non-specific lipid-transfer protein 2-like [Nicotiana sylvestris]XP_016433620.1 PREDICTED: non-specific lipid-transfer protein 2-like [Nicotiana tabacum]
MARKIAIFVVLCMVALAANRAYALTCTDVYTYLDDCEPYLTNPDHEHEGDLPKCCDGVRQLEVTVTTTIDRQTACTCLKSAGDTFIGIDWFKAALLPSLCGVTLPYTISADFDCTKVI